MNARNPIQSRIAPFDRLPPHSVEAEMCVIGALLLAGEDAAVVAGIRATVSAGDFFQADHQILFVAACDVYDRCRTLDAMLLREELVRRQTLGDVGGVAYLAEILHAVPNARAGAHYAHDVREKSVLRRLIAGASDVLRRAYGPMNGTRADELARDFLAQLHGVAEGRCADTIVKLDRVIADILNDRANGIANTVRTGLNELDATCAGGLPARGYTVLAGRPGMGKSQLGKQIARNVAGGLPERRDAYGDVIGPAQPPIACGIVTVEELNRKIGCNYLSAVSGVENNRVVNNTCSENEWQLVKDAAPDLAGLPVYLTDRPIHLADVESVITTMVTRFRCGFIFVDYLQLIQGPEAANKEQEIARISTTLKNLGKTLGVTMVVAAQLSRANEAGGVRRPELRDLRHSGQIEQDGDLIVLLHRDDYYHCKEENFVPTHVLEAIVAKNKNGPMGTALLHFEGKFQTVRDRKAAETYPPTVAPQDQDILDSI